MIRTKKIEITIIFILILAGITGCAPTGSENPVNTMVAATFQAMTLQAQSTPLETSTSLVPTATLPNLTLTSPAPPSAIRISFTTGATFGIAQGALQPGQSQTYVLEAAGGQPMIAMVDSLNHDITFGIFGNNGTVLVDNSQAVTTWQGLLPSNQDYYIKINSGTITENYTLSVTLASRIHFDSGATSATLNGSTVDGYNVTFVLRASVGQNMNINLAIPSGTAALTVWGFTDGQPYLRAQLGQINFSLDLPSTQDYIIEVVPQGGSVVTFSLKVDVH